MFSIKNIVLLAFASFNVVNGVFVSLERFSDSECKSQISNESINDNGCLVVGGGVSSSYRLNTNAGQGTDWQPCGDGQFLILKTWQSSTDCSGEPDSGIGPISPDDNGQGGCGLTPIRSVQIICG